LIVITWQPQYSISLDGFRPSGYRRIDPKSNVGTNQAADRR
jgi:hypothetical protein